MSDIMICCGSLKFKRNLSQTKKDYAKQASQGVLAVSGDNIICPYKMTWISESEFNDSFSYIKKNLLGKLSGYFLGLKGRNKPQKIAIAVEKDGIDVYLRDWDWKLCYGNKK